MWLPPEQTHVIESAAKGAQVNFQAMFTTLVSVVGGFGSIVAVYKTYADLFQSRSVLSKRNDELARAGKFVDLSKQFANENIAPEQQQAFKKHIQECLQESLARIDDLDRHLALIRQDPNSTLNIHERMFLLFRPLDSRGWVLHFLTYITVGLLGWYLFQSGVDSSGFSLNRFLAYWKPSIQYLTVMSMVFLVLLFRAWSLTERKRVLGYRKPAGKLARFFVTLCPESVRMLIAQLLFFPSTLLLLAAVEQVTVLHFSGIRVWIVVIFLFASITFRNWAAAEFRYQEKRPELSHVSAVLFSNFFGSLAKYGLLRLQLFLAFLLMPLLLVAALIAIRTPMAAAGLVLGVMATVVPYALFRRLRIKCSLQASMPTQPEVRASSMAASA